MPSFGSIIDSRVQNGVYIFSAVSKLTKSPTQTVLVGIAKHAFQNKNGKF